MIRAIAAACAVGLVALTLILGSLRHGSTAVSSLPEPPVSHPVVPPVVIAPPPVAVPPARTGHPKRKTRVHVTAHPHRSVTVKRVAVRPTIDRPPDGDNADALEPAPPARHHRSRSRTSSPRRKTAAVETHRPAVDTARHDPTGDFATPRRRQRPARPDPSRTPTPPVTTVPATPPPVVTVSSETKYTAR